MRRTRQHRARPTRISSTDIRRRSAALIQYALIAGVVAFAARGIPPATLGFIRPGSWLRAGGLTIASLLAIWIAGAGLNVFLKAGEEQGLVPDEWDSSRAGPFLANFVVIAVVAPIVEETTYRGLGFAAVADRLGPDRGDRDHRHWRSGSRTVC